MLTLALALGFLVPATAACLYYLLPTLAGCLRRPPRGDQADPVHTFAVLIPAHDEESSLPATLRSVAALDWPPEMVRVYVVADNCTDRTADAAEAGGAIALVRDDPDNRGKGHALAFGLDRLLEDNPDVVLILDADCGLNAGALRAFDAVFAAGAEVAQAAVRNGNPDDGPGPYVVTVGDAVNVGLAAGLDRLGRSVPLRGTGMGLRRTVLERVRWVAFGAVEDAEYEVRLRAAGVRVRYGGGAVVSCAAPARAGDLDRQRRR
ncbi:MAG: hypothetical protein JWO38_1589, partial [Gemmataceae bacterium]|nr:hypothetical protein [Gemmataceae bacterium]